MRKPLLIVALLVPVVVLAACGSGDSSALRLSEREGVSEVATCSQPVLGFGGGGKEDVVPVIFVHGFIGSASQFQSQAIRLVQNGYPASHLAALEQDGLTGLNQEIEPGRTHLELIEEVLDACIRQLRMQTGADRVDLIGHSRGTSVALSYLADTEHASRVRRYVNIDGSAGETAPAEVPTLAIWDFRDRGPMSGAQANVTFEQGHVQVATSAQSFAEIFAFLNDEPPRQTAIFAVPQGRRVTLHGRAMVFPFNEGLEEGEVEIFALDERGRRMRGVPDAVLEFGPRGRWGPFEAISGQRYEFVIRRPEDLDHHHFREPFVTDNHFVRLVTVPGEGSLLDALVATDERHTNITVLRDKEFWGDPAEDPDRLEIDGVNVTAPPLAPRSAGKVALFAFDADTDGQSHLDAPVEPISNVPFLLGVDLFIEADDSVPPTTFSEVRLTGRGTGGVTRTLHVPRWPGTVRLTTVRFNDFVAE